LSVNALVRLIAGGLRDDISRDDLVKLTREAVEGLFGTRYHAWSRWHARTESLKAPPDEHPYAGLLHDESPEGGLFGGMALVWFPVSGQIDRAPSSLLTVMCGPRGLAPDEGILGRPGHARQLAALARHLVESTGVAIWTKRDPADLTRPFPLTVAKDFAPYERVLDRYGQHIYAAVDVPRAAETALAVVSAFLDFYATERGWSPAKEAEEEVAELRKRMRANIFPHAGEKTVVELLRERRFVILQGPPGTGKSRMAASILEGEFDTHGTTVQFHPAITYESFVAGIAPVPRDDALRFRVTPGPLVKAIRESHDADYLLVIEDINRADLASVLGEAIYLLEYRDIVAGEGRTIQLPYRLDDGQTSLQVPETLHVLGTMNTADRSLAIRDLGVRRRFAFVDMWPDMGVVFDQDLELATEAAGRLVDVFVQFATDDALPLLPGQAYFLADNEEELVSRLRYDVIPLLREYLEQGLFGPCEGELRAYVDWLDSEISVRGY
jgi:5-methylcytosine-specific restriction protein B